jgi:hypothetical protein
VIVRSESRSQNCASERSPGTLSRCDPADDRDLNARVADLAVTEDRDCRVATGGNAGKEPAHILCDDEAAGCSDNRAGDGRLDCIADGLRKLAIVAERTKFERTAELLLDGGRDEQHGELPV